MNYKRIIFKHMSSKKRKIINFIKYFYYYYYKSEYHYYDLYVQSVLITNKMVNTEYRLDYLHIIFTIGISIIDLL